MQYVEVCYLEMGTVGTDRIRRPAFQLSRKVVLLAVPVSGPVQNKCSKLMKYQQGCIIIITRLNNDMAKKKQRRTSNSDSGSQWRRCLLLSKSTREVSGARRSSSPRTRRRTTQSIQSTASSVLRVALPKFEALGCAACMSTDSDAYSCEK